MTIYEKIAKIQDEVEVRKEADNPFFHSKYATYEGVLNAIHGAMRKYGLVAFHSFEPSAKDGYITVVTYLVDTSGKQEQGIGQSFPSSPASVESKLEIPLVKNDPQSAGSAITYAKRYALLAILGLGTEDDDAEKAMPREPKHEIIKGDVYHEAMQKEACKSCGGKMVFNRNTGKFFCENKCWLKGNK